MPYLTPPSVPTPAYCRRLLIPNSPEWIGLVSGVLLPLIYEYSWKQEPGGIPVAEAAARWQLMLDQYWGDDGACGIMDVRQSLTDPCTLEKTFDGVTWIPFANILACAGVLASSAVPLRDVRIDPDDDVTPQFSPDGGTTWIDVPGDPEAPPIVTPPAPVPGPDPEAQACLGARRAALVLGEFYKSTYGAFTADLLNTINDVNTFLSQLNQALFSFVYPQAAQIAQAFGFGAQDFSSEYTAATLTSDQLDALTCLLLEHSTVPFDGIVQFDFAAVQSGVVGAVGVNPGVALQSLLTYIQSGGLNAASGTAIVDSYDCIDCIESCIFQSFAGFTQGWTVFAGTAGPSGLVATTSVGVNAVAAYLTIDPTYINEFSITFDRSVSGANTKQIALWYLDAEGNYIPTITTPGVSGNDLVLTLPIADTATQIGIYIQNGSTGSALVENATIRWTGADPGFEGTPCLP